MKREGSLTVIAFVLLGLYVVVLFQILADYRLGFKMGQRKAWSQCHYFILHRISPETAGRSSGSATPLPT